MERIKGALPPLGHELAREYLARAQAGELEARELLVRHNLLLVKNAAARFTGADAMDDLFQVGCIGLIKAIDNFDLSRDTAFSTYALPRILGEIRMYLRDNKPVKVSRALVRISGLVKSCRRRLEQELGREPSIGEVAAQLDLGVEEVAAAETVLAPMVDIAETDLAQPMDELKVALREVIGRLAKRERQVIGLRYFEDFSQQQVADKLGISQGQVSKIEREVLSKLRTAMG